MYIYIYIYIYQWRAGGVLNEEAVLCIYISVACVVVLK